jgi:catalase
MGILYLEAMAASRGIDVDSMSYNPMRLPAGIEPSDDEILHARGEIYALACHERKGTGCPMHAHGRKSK